MKAFAGAELQGSLHIAHPISQIVKAKKGLTCHYLLWGVPV